MTVMPGWAWLELFTGCAEVGTEQYALDIMQCKLDMEADVVSAPRGATPLGTARQLLNHDPLWYWLNVASRCW